MGEATLTGVVVLSRRRDAKAGVLLVASFGAFLAFLDSTIVNVAFPDMQKDFAGASYASLSWVLNAYNIVFAALLVTAGRFADLLGRRRTFVGGVLIFTLSSAVIAVAPSLGWLVGARVVQAVGAATLVPASLALVIDAFPGDRRSHAIGLWGAAAALAAGLGPPIGGLLVDASGWRLAFLVNVPMGIGALLASRVALVESRAPGRRTLPDLPGSALLALGLGSVTTALVQGEHWGWLSWRIVSFAVVGVVLVLVFAARSTRHPSPVVDPALLRLPGFGSALGLTVVAGMGFYAYLLTHILWLTYIWGYDIVHAGLAVMPGAFVAAAVAGTAGKVADKHGARVLVIPGALLWSGSFLWYLTAVGTTPHFLTQWLPGQVMSGIGVGLTLPILSSAAVAAVPGGRYATASALSSSARQLGAVLGVSVLVIIIGQPSAAGARAAFRHGWVFSAICFAAVAVGALMLRRAAPVEEGVADDVTSETVAIGDITHAATTTRTATRSEYVDARSTVDLLRAAPIFAPLPATVLAALAKSARSVSVAAGELLFDQGAKADSLYIVKTGRLEVVRDGTVVDEVTRGGVVGELGLVTGAPRAAAVRARRDSELLRVSRATFSKSVLNQTGAAHALATDLARRLQEGDAAAPKGAQRPRLVAVAPAVDGPTPVAFVADLLARALADRADVVVPGQVSAAELERLEREHDIVLLVATSAGAWRDAILRQADRVVLVAGSTDTPPERSMRIGERHAELLLLGNGVDRQTIDRWQAATAPAQVVVSSLAAPELDRVAQRVADQLTGRSIGLVLTGGGARALAHIGVVAELLDAGVTIGRVAGCSMGAYIGALFAMGLDADAIDARVYEEYVRRNPAGDYTLPRHALTRGRRGYAMLDRSFGDLDVESLPRQLVTTAVDLYRRELVVLSSGKVRDLVAGSIALPGISPPHVLGDRVLVDGGVLDNSPVRPLLARGEGPVILSSVLDPGGAAAPRRTGPPRRPPVVETVLRAMTTGSAEATRHAHESASLVITPGGRGVGLLEFHQIDRMVEAGRVAARAALDAAPAGLIPMTAATL